MKKRVLIIVGIVIAIILIWIAYYEFIEGVPWTISGAARDTPLEAVEEINGGHNIVAETIGYIELKNAEIYIWRSNDNMIMISYIIINNSHTKYYCTNSGGNSADPSFDNIYDPGWYVYKAERYPVAIILTPTDVQFEKFDGRDAQYKNFNVTINGIQHTFRAFYVDLTQKN